MIMQLKISFTDYYLEDGIDKTLCYFKNDQLFLSNIVDIKWIDFFKDILPEFSEIIYFEHDRPECSNCGFEMNDNGSRESKPNKQKGIRKKQYICPKCGKTHLTSLEPFISRYSNYSYDICERGLNYDYIAYLSYDKKRELINFENNIKIARQTIYYHESTYDKTFLKRQEEINQKLLKERGIEPTGYYHYDEQYPRQNGELLVRLALIDAINNLPINELLIEKEDFDKNTVEAFLESSLFGLPKEALITDGAPMYRDIIDKMGIKHQLCIFHIIKNHHSKTYTNISRVARRIRTIYSNIKGNKTTINMLEKEIMNNNYSKKKKSKKREKIEKLKKDNKKLRKERKERKKELNELLATNERIEKIYTADDKKASTRRFNTLNNRRKFLDKNTCSFLENLDKKFDRTVKFYEDPFIPRTNNNIERYFGITLPSYIKRKYRSIEGLTRWLRLQKIRWIRRNVLQEPGIENLSTAVYLQEKNYAIA